MRPLISSLTSPAGLIGALFGTFLSMQIMGCMWLFDNWQYRITDKSLKFRALVAWNLFIIVAGCFLCVSGTCVLLPLSSGRAR